MNLEARYRAALRWYPSDWREKNADVVVGTLMDEADATGRLRPRAIELAILALNGVRLRLSRVGFSAATRDRASAMAYAAGFVISLAMLVCSEWAPWSTVPFTGWFDQPAVPFGVFATPAVVLYGLTIAGFIVALVGLARVASVIMFAVLGLGFVMHLFRYDLNLRVDSSALMLLGFLALVAALGRPVGRRRIRWLTLSTVGMVVLLVALWWDSIVHGTLFDLWHYQFERAGVPEEFFGGGRMDPRSGSQLLFNITIWLVASGVIAAVAAVFKRRDWMFAAVELVLLWPVICVAAPIFFFVGGDSITVVMGLCVAIAVGAIAFSAPWARGGARARAT